MTMALLIKKLFSQRIFKKSFVKILDERNVNKLEFRFRIKKKEAIKLFKLNKSATK